MSSEPPSINQTLPALIEIKPGKVSGYCEAPGSKSVTNRAVLLAGLADGESILRNPLISTDSAAMVGFVRAIGAEVDDSDPEAWRIKGVAGKLQTPSEPINCRLSGTAMRFGTAVAALCEGKVTLTGEPPLLKRPLHGLLEALEDLGVKYKAKKGGYPPVKIGGGIEGGHVDIDVQASSQFASAVLLAAPLAKHDVTVTVNGDFAETYVDLTLSAMRDWGVFTQEIDEGWHVSANQTYQAQDIKMEYDASAAAHLLSLAVTTGGEVTVSNAVPTIQGDADMVTLFADFGANVDISYPSITVKGPKRPISPGKVDLSQMPDQIGTVAAIAAVASGTTEIRGAEVVRGHEVDRIWAIHKELKKLGVPVEELKDGLIITGVERIKKKTVKTYHDHRMAMGFAALGARLEGITIEEPDCVSKTFPLFFHELFRMQGFELK